jgi:mono/diheme cytochrome c family protein
MRHTDAKRGRMSNALRGSLAAAILLAGCMGDDRQEATQATSASNCATAPALFTDKVWPSLEQSCVVCHASGRVAAGTKLVFATGGGTELQNYNILRDFVANTGDLVLTKSIGLPTHGGGKPFVDANSQQYKDLQALMPTLRETCAPAVGSMPPAQAQFWQGVTFADDATTLARAAVLFAGRNPTAQESAAVSTGGANALRQTIRGYMQGPAFDRFLEEAGMTHFLTRRVVARDNNRGLVSADFPALANIPSADASRFDASVRREPIELMKFIVKGDRPWTDMVAGDYTVVNGVLAQYLGAQVQGTFTNATDDNEWLPARVPSRLGGVREHAGVLSTHAWLDSFPTTATNRNRHRVYILAKQFLATDITALGMRAVDDSGQFRVPVLENPACTTCHDTMDPIAAGFQNWAANNRYLPFKSAAGKDIALPGNYRASSYPRDANNQPYYREGDNWFRDQKAPGYGQTPMPGGFSGSPTALQWLGQQVAADSRFALGAVHFWYEAVFGREPLKAPLTMDTPDAAAQLAAYNAQHAEFEEIAARFRAGGYKVKDLLVDLVTSRWFRAARATGLNAARAAQLADVGSLNLLTPTQLNLKLAGLVGQAWTEFNNPYAGLALNYGDFDAIDRLTRAKSYTMLQAVTIDRLASTRSCALAQADFARPAGSRLLFPAVALTDTPATTAGRDAIVANVRHLHKWLWKEDVPAADAEVQRTVKLFEDVWAARATAPVRPVACGFNNSNDPNYTGRAWAAVLAYMLGDPKFLYE